MSQRSFWIVLTTVSLHSCNANRYAIDDLSTQRAVATAKSIAPDLKVEEVEREKEFGKISWTVEGEVRGQDVEIEFEENADHQGGDSAKAIRAK